MKLTHPERAERRRIMAVEVERGESTQEVARRHRVTRAQVTNACQEHGVQPRGRKLCTYPRTSHLRTYAAICRAEPGDSLATVGARLGISKQAVWEVCQYAWRLGLPTGRWAPPRPKPP